MRGSVSRSWLILRLRVQRRKGVLEELGGLEWAGGVVFPNAPSKDVGTSWAREMAPAAKECAAESRCPRSKAARACP
jgi:hypothetical protein